MITKERAIELVKQRFREKAPCTVFADDTIKLDYVSIDGVRQEFKLTGSDLIGCDSINYIKFTNTLAGAIVDANEAARRIYDSVQPTAVEIGPYVWGSGVPAVEEEVKPNWKPNIPPMEQKFVDKEKMWEAIKAIARGGSSRSHDEETEDNAE